MEDKLWNNRKYTRSETQSNARKVAADSWVRVKGSHGPLTNCYKAALLQYKCILPLYIKIYLYILIYTTYSLNNRRLSMPGWGRSSMKCLLILNSAQSEGQHREALLHLENKATSGNPKPQTNWKCLLLAIWASEMNCLAFCVFKLYMFSTSARCASDIKWHGVHVWVEFLGLESESLGPLQLSCRQYFWSRFPCLGLRTSECFWSELSCLHAHFTYLQISWAGHAFASGHDNVNAIHLVEFKLELLDLKVQNTRGLVRALWIYAE